MAKAMRRSKSNDEQVHTTLLSITYQNVRGLRTKLDDLKANLMCTDQDIIYLTETFLNLTHFDIDFAPPDMTVHRADRHEESNSEKRGGGSMILVKDYIKAKRRKDLELRAECVWLEIIKHNGKRVMIGNHNLAPLVTKEEYAFNFDELFNRLENWNDEILLLGDFNVPGVDWELNLTASCNPTVKPKAQELLDFTLSLNLHQHNKLKNLAGNILDLVLVNQPYTKVTEDMTPLSKIDTYHPPLTIKISYPDGIAAPDFMKNLKNPKSQLNFKKGEYKGLYTYLRGQNWDEVTSAKEIDESVEHLHAIINKGFKLFIPEKRKGNRTKFPFWFSVELRKALNRNNIFIESTNVQKTK